jgi:diguanylate cyclase (GGDEF)-like protein/PAS domain S-box-containing protein
MHSIHPEEQRRLDTLRTYDIVDTRTEDDFDRLTRLAARICEAPFATIAFVDHEHQRFKSVAGLKLRDIKRSIAFCAHAIRDNRLLVVADARTDPQFAGHPLVTGAPHVRFYAGMPLVAPDGCAIGTLAVMDRVPRTLSDEQAEALQTLAAQVMAQFELRRRRHAEDAAGAREGQNMALLRIAGKVSRVGGWEVALPDLRVSWSDEICRMLEIEHVDSPSVEQAVSLYAPSSAGRIMQLFDACLRMGTPYDEEIEMVTGTGRRLWARAVGNAVRDDAGRIIRIHGALQDITEKKLAEQALAQSEQRFRQLADAMPHVVWTATADGVIDFTNRTATDYSGLTIDYPGKDWTRILHPDDVGRTLAAWGAAVGSGSPFTIEYRLLHAADQTYRWHFISAMPIRNEGGDIVKWYGTCTDIHDRKQAGDEARRLAERLSVTLESITDAFFTLDRESRFTYVNGEAERLFGRVRADMLARVIWNGFVDATDPIFAPVQEALQHRRSAAHEAYSVSLRRWLDVRATPSDDGVAVYCRDVSDRRDAEDRLRLSEERLRLTLDNALDPHVAIDAGGRIIQWNRQAEHFFGWQRSEVLGAPLHETIIPPGMRDAHLAGMRRYLGSGGGTSAVIGQRIETSALRRNGEESPVELSIVPIVTGQGVIFSASIRDIAERTQLRRFKAEQTAILESVAAGAPLSDVLEALTRIVEVQAADAMCSIMLLDDDGCRLRLAAAPHLPPAFCAVTDNIEIGPAVGSCGTAAYTRRFVLASDIASDPRWEHFRETTLQHGLRACWSQPIMASNGRVLGTFAVYASQPRSPQPAETDMLASCAHVASIAIERELAQASARRNEERLRLQQRAIEVCANPIAIIRTDAPEHPVEYVNAAVELVTGYPPMEIIGRNLRVLWEHDPEQPGLLQLRAAHQRQQYGRGTLQACRRDGSKLWLDIHLSPVPDETGAVSHFVVAMYDITAARQYESELEYQSNYDALTGLANRNLLRDRASQAIARAASIGLLVPIVYIDLDRFRFVIDTLGHEAGDVLLRQVAQRLRHAARPTDTVARVAADEFVIVLEESADEHAAAALVQRAMQAVAQPLTVDKHDYFMTCSVGIAVYPSDGDDAETLIRRAKLAVHRAKQNGGNDFRFYTAAMNRHAMEELQLEGDLRQAVRRNELLLHYQPQVDLRTGRIVGMEALLRWCHPRLGMVPPGRFIPIAEESGQILTIGAWVLRTACRQNKAWQDAGFSPLRVAVNLSGKQFYQSDLIPLVSEVLAETGLSAQWLELELTEGLVTVDMKHAVSIMRELKTMGVKLSIDDFGTGYSSLSYLKSFPIDVLKIDQAFVRNITTDPDEATIARSIITLAHSLRLQVIAEGVETEAQLSYLQRHRCDQIQGYHFSRPLPASGFEQLLAQDKRLPQADRAGAVQQQTLLIVDDEESVTASLTRMLRGQGYRILRAHSAEEGLTLLALHEVQVILCDQRMPFMSGTQFLSKVKKLYPDTLRLMLTGYTGIDSIIEATNSGAVFRLHTKPWDSEVLSASIADAFRYYWLMHGEDGRAPTEPA